MVGHVSRHFLAAQFIDLGDQVLDAALVQLLVCELDFGGQDAVEEDAADCGIDQAGLSLGQSLTLVVVPGGGPQLDTRVHVDLAQLIGEFDLVEIGEGASIALVRGLVQHGQVVDAQDHVLRGRDDRLAIRGLQKVA